MPSCLLHVDWCAHEASEKAFDVHVLLDVEAAHLETHQWILVYNIVYLDLVHRLMAELVHV